MSGIGSQKEGFPISNIFDDDLWSAWRADDLVSASTFLYVMRFPQPILFESLTVRGEFLFYLIVFFCSCCGICWEVSMIMCDCAQFDVPVCLDLDSGRGSDLLFFDK